MPNAVATNVNTDSGLLYLTHYDRRQGAFGDSALQVIDAEGGDVVASIDAGRLPRDVAVNPYTDNIYVIESRKLHVFDSVSLEQINEIELNNTVRNMAINPDTNKIFVTPVNTNEVSVIDELNGKVVSTIHVGAPNRGDFGIENRYKIDVNPNTNMIYIANSKTNRLYVVNGSTDTLVSGINFKVYPANTGEIYCNDKKVSDGYFRLKVGEVRCTATAGKDFVFSSWSANQFSSPNSSFSSVPTGQTGLFAPLFSSKPDINEIKLENNGYGNLTALFREAPLPVEFTIPTQTLIQILLIIITAVIGWLIPSIVAWINKHRHKNDIINYMNEINNANNKDRLEELKREISNRYAEGILNSSNYEILKNRISDLVSGLS